MLIPPGPVRVLVATKPVDFRKGMNGLAALVQEQLKADPFSGTIYCPLETRRPGETRLLGRHGPLPAVQAPGGRQVPLAARAGRRDASVCGAVERASRRSRLESRARAKSDAAASCTVIFVQ